jgi:hypothetical protein
MDEQPEAPAGPYLTVAELAKRWHTTPNAIYVRRHKRTAPKGWREGRRILISLADIEAHEAKGQAADSRFNTDLDPTKKPVETRISRRRKTAA